MLLGIVKVAVTVLIVLAILLLYACAVISKRADEQIRKMNSDFEYDTER